jgi:hypothetical protein
MKSSVVSFNKLHLEAFKKCFPKPPNQAAVGDNPEDYLARLNDLCGKDLKWPSKHPKGALTRDDLIKIARDSSIDVLIVYAAVMAWGGRGLSSPNYKRSLDLSTLGVLRSALESLRQRTENRERAFRAFQMAANAFKGLKVSFYTKLLFFIRSKADAYILDQFTAKSAQLLFDPPPVRLTSQGYPLTDTTPSEYESFCSNVEALACELSKANKDWTAEKVEQAMFDVRGGSWRKYLNGHFSKTKKPSTRATKRTAVPSATAESPASGQGDLQRLLALKIQEVHRAGLDGGARALPVLDGTVTESKPFRLHCCTVDGEVCSRSSVHTCRTPESV